MRFLFLQGNQGAGTKAEAEVEIRVEDMYRLAHNNLSQSQTCHCSFRSMFLHEWPSLQTK